MNAQEILKEAARLVAEDRENSHGDKEENFARIAKGFQFWLEIRPDPSAPINSWDVGNLMEIMKIARRCTGAHNIDDYVDGAGYAACAGDIAERGE